MRLPRPLSRSRRGDTTHAAKQDVIRLLKGIISKILRAEIGHVSITRILFHAGAIARPRAADGGGGSIRQASVPADGADSELIRGKQAHVAVAAHGRETQPPQ